jgi:outer membrane protein OmpA-like peptidoglycan-associated protein
MMTRSCNCALLTLVLLAFAVTGCASKKYVRTTVGSAVDPVKAKVDSVEKKVGEQGGEIETLNSGLSKTREELSDVNRKAGEANAAALRANESATAAGQRADAAMTAANAVDSRVAALRKSLEAMGTYSEMSKESVFFGVSRSDLTAESTGKLDAVVAKLNGAKLFVVEVHGYADPVGNAAANQQLSERRANAVVRYLAAKGVPLRAMHVVGVGEVEGLEMKGKSRQEVRELRAQARRVDVAVYVPGQ